MDTYRLVSLFSEKCFERDTCESLLFQINQRLIYQSSHSAKSINLNESFDFSLYDRKAEIEKRLPILNMELNALTEILTPRLKLMWDQSIYGTINTENSKLQFAVFLIDGIAQLKYPNGFIKPILK